MGLRHLALNTWQLSVTLLEAMTHGSFSLDTSSLLHFFGLISPLSFLLHVLATLELFICFFIVNQAASCFVLSLFHLSTAWLLLPLPLLHCLCHRRLPMSLLHLSSCYQCSPHYWKWTKKDHRRQTFFLNLMLQQWEMQHRRVSLSKLTKGVWAACLYSQKRGVWINHNFVSLASVMPWRCKFVTITAFAVFFF